MVREPRTGRRRAIVVWECFDKAPSAELRRRVICRFCGHDCIASPLTMARHIAWSCPHVDDAHRRRCSEYRSWTGKGLHDGAASTVVSPARDSLSPVPSAAAAAGVAEPEEMETEELLEDASATQLSAADSSRDGQQWRPQEEEASDFESASVRAAKSSDDGSVHDGDGDGDGDDHDNRPEESAATPSNASAPAAIEELSVAEMESVWTDLVLAVTSQDAAARPEEIALHLRGSFDAIRREVLEHHPVQRQKLPFLVHLCTGSLGPARCAHRQLLAEAVPSVDRPDGAAAAAPVLIGGCMMQQSLLLFHDALETLSSVRAGLKTCVEVASFVASCEPLRRDLKWQHLTLDLTPQPPSAKSFHSFLVCVNQVLALKDPLFAVIGDDSSSSSRAHRGGVPAYLASARALRFETLAPFACLLALSDAGHATSGQLLACWLLLRATVVSSSLVSDKEKAVFSTRFVDRVRESGDTQAFASLVVDPRVQGVGLSALGKRKARLIIADLAERLQPSVDRSRLVVQLLTFLTRLPPFDDDADSWNMMASLPHLFWLEYVEEMPELASVALAVLSYRPHLAPLEETWRELVPRCQRPALSPESCLTVANGAFVPGEGGDNLQAVLELERVKLHFQNASNSSSDQRRGRSADAARVESLRKYRKCFVRESDDGTLDTLFDESFAKSGGLEERSGGVELSRDASAELQQLRLWLQRVDEYESSGAAADTNAQLEADGSLSRFQVEWLDVSTNCAQRMRTCVKKFTIGSHRSR
ncbi:hypothetical protein PybrP1_001324 [[Pythium] brassicae (nom. inval.)]|nr:hypothetical protein PybrP1_001324 [[Pythium] brassicae (nom. inval.)]